MEWRPGGAHCRRLAGGAWWGSLPWTCWGSPPFSTAGTPWPAGSSAPPTGINMYRDTGIPVYRDKYRDTGINTGIQG